MELLSLPVEERLNVMEELLSCLGPMFRWIYSPEGEILFTNCPHMLLHKILERTGFLEEFLRFSKQNTAPAIASVPIGFMWCAVPEHNNGALSRIHVLGPIATTELSLTELETALHNSTMPQKNRPKFNRVLADIPVEPALEFFKKTLVLHYCVTGEKLTNGDIVFMSNSRKEHAIEFDSHRRDRMLTYMNEQALLNKIRQGDLDYKSALTNASRISSGVSAVKRNPLVQAKVSQVAFITLATRAAIEGGVSPEVAYSRGDASIQSVMDSRSISEMAQIGHAMYVDFIHLVHKTKLNPTLSKEIQSCCDYISTYSAEKLTISDVAAHVGYSDYYLSRKFKEETGVSVNDYIKNVKVERAKSLLATTMLSIQDICDQLNFGSRTFFSETFKEIAGMPPAAYRKQNQHM